MRKIIHIDMDCFYAAVEAKHRPELRGKPIGIGGPPNTRSVLCTASYEARKFGVRAAMPSSQAVRLCPSLILVPPNFSLYKRESAAVRAIMNDYTDKIEPLSLDEAYLDVTDSEHCEGSATRIAAEIRGRIQKELSLTASAGIAPNKFLAKIASDWKKPNGQFVIRPEDIDKFMPSLKVEKIFGVGKVTAKRMHELNLHTCGDIQKKTVPELTRWFGSRAQELSLLSRGQDDRAVEAHSERKSLTVEETFNADLQTLPEWVERLPELYKDWAERMGRHKSTHNNESHIRGFVVKVRFHDFQSMTREMASTAWPEVSDFEKLLLKVWEQRPEAIRLLGLGVRMGSDKKNETNVGQLNLWD
jgi:DNA polymerase IV